MARRERNGMHKVLPLDSWSMVTECRQGIPITLTPCSKTLVGLMIPFDLCYVRKSIYSVF